MANVSVPSEAEWLWCLTECLTSVCTIQFCQFCFKVCLYRQLRSLEVFEEESVTLHIGRELQHHQPAAFWCVFTVTAPWGLQKDVAVPREKFQARLW